MHHGALLAFDTPERVMADETVQTAYLGEPSDGRLGRGQRGRLESGPPRLLGQSHVLQGVSFDGSPPAA